MIEARPACTAWYPPTKPSPASHKNNSVPRSPGLMILGFVVSLPRPLHPAALRVPHRSPRVFMATMITIILATADYANWVVVGLGAVLLGVLMVSMPALAHPWTRKITGDDSVAIGHFGTAGYVASGAVGKLVGGKGAKASKSTEDLKLPEGLRFLPTPWSPPPCRCAMYWSSPSSS